MLSSQLTELEEEDILDELERLGSEEPDKINIPISVTEATKRAREEKQEKIAAEEKKTSASVSETIIITEKKVLEGDDLEEEWATLAEKPAPAKAKPKRKYIRTTSNIFSFVILSLAQKERKIAEPAM
jgi:hypothetical protein